MTRGRRQAITATDLPANNTLSLFKVLWVCLFGREFSLKISTMKDTCDGYYQFWRSMPKSNLVTLQLN